MATGTIYNATDGPLTLDDDGHVLGAREHRDNVELDGRKADGKRIRAHIDAGRLVVIEEPEAKAEKPARTRSNEEA